jgi:two-component system cell cycle sensor histidine kinase/response regulator CckA
MSHAIRALILEDNRSDALPLLSALQNDGFEVEYVHVDSEDDFRRALDQDFDVILSDYSLPQFDALRALAIGRERAPDVPFIMISGTIGEDTAVEVMKAGAADYLLKDRLGRLGGAVARGLELRRVKREKHEAERMAYLRDRAIEACSQAVVIADALSPDMPVLYANQAFEAITGYRRDEVVGRNCRFLQGPETDPAAVTAVRQALLTGRPCAVEILNYRKDGTRFWNALTVAPVRDAAGRVTHFVGTQSDVTEKKTLERQLLQAQKLEAVGRLAGGIAHDFNNLLTIILGYSEFVLSEPHSEEAPELIREIQRAGERAASLTRQLLLFSRKHVAAPQVFNLNEVVNAAQKLLQRLIGDDLRLATDLDPTECYVQADPSQVEQVLMNLVVNARDAMPKGGDVRITTRNVPCGEWANPDPTLSLPGSGSSAEEWVRLSVADTGHGMDEATLQRIFEPFFTTKEGGKGTGLGLSMVFGVIKQAGGAIEVQSRPGAGATFDIYLPSAKEILRRTALSVEYRPPRGSETVLLVEDNADVRSFTRMALEGHGYAVLEADGGPAALELARRHTGPLHLLVTDVVMPEMSGRELAEKLHEEFKQLEVLYVSGFMEEALIHYGVRTGSVAFLQKPFTSGALARRVRDLLDRHPLPAR